MVPTCADTVQFFCSSQLFGEKNKSVYSDPPSLPASPCLSLTGRFEYRSLNWIPGIWPVHSYYSLLSTHFSLSISLTFYIQPPSQLSLSPLCPTAPLRFSSYEIQDVTFFSFPPAVLLNSYKYVRGNMTVRWSLGGVRLQKNSFEHEVFPLKPLVGTHIFF